MASLPSTELLVMWCSHCNKETTSVPNQTGEGICCALCGEPFNQEKPTEDAIRQARDIIARWSSSDLLDRISTLPEIPPLHRYELSDADDSDMPAADSADLSNDTSTRDTEQPAMSRTNPTQETVSSADERSTAEERDDNQFGEVLESAHGDEQESLLEPFLDSGVAADSFLSPEGLPETPQFEALQREQPSSVSLVDSKAELPQSDADLPDSEGPAPAPQERTENIAAGDLQHTVRSHEDLTERERSQTTSSMEADQAAADTTSPAMESSDNRRDNNVDADSDALSGAISPDEPASEPADSATITNDAVLSPTAAVPPSTRRTHQPRMAQERAMRERKQAPSATDEGTKSMSRKFRIDTPGGERTEQPESDPRNVAGTRIQSNSKSGKRHRIDTGSPVADTLETGNQRARTHGRPRRRYIDEAHDSVARGPHFQVTAPRRSNFTSITGQFLAYVGVLGLTVGTAMVIYGHFGGYSEYTPTGWLVTTVAQMMLFLGVINLVSGGMEQNNTDVSQRMEYLGSQLMRIEQVAEEALRGPKISAQRYADPNAEVEVSDREQALVEE